MKKLSDFNKLIIFSFALLLSACAGFDEKFDPEQVKWSQEVGDKTVIVRGYYITADDKSESRCSSISDKATLMPDTPYFREWLQILATPYAFHSSPSNKALEFVRHTPWQEDCIYKFNNVPAGNWLLMINIRPRWERTCSKYGCSGAYLVPYYLYVPLVVKPEDTIVKKNAVIDYSNVGWFTWRRQLRPGALYDWTDPVK